MPHINRALLRKRSEHNEGLISTLEEISLHQEELEGINEGIREIIFGIPIFNYFLRFRKSPNLTFLLFKITFQYLVQHAEGLKFYICKIISYQKWKTCII